MIVESVLLRSISAVRGVVNVEKQFTTFSEWLVHRDDFEWNVTLVKAKKYLT